MKSAQYRVQAALEEVHWWHRGKLSIVRDVLRRLAPPGARVADVGCGTGGNLSGLAVEYDCAGADPSEEAVALARERFPGVAFFTGPAPEALGDFQGRADVLMLLDVLEHVEDDRGLLARVLAAAKPGAHVLITVPASMGLWSLQDVNLGHFRRYEEGSLRALWRGQPVRERLFSFYNARLYPFVWAARAVSHRWNRTWGSAGTDVGRVPGPLNAVLKSLFAGEGPRLASAIDTGRLVYRRGVSLIAVLRKEL